MSKLIGTDPNQVPSNADLGSAAFMDKKEFLLSRGSNISSIDAVLHSDAVDVFIYDTSKDSDGGAWRKRTQDKSWYNEKLNTSIRGNRKEFPAVAILVAETTKLTIYDGDDPTLPMWMVFERGTGNWPNVTSVFIAASGSANIITRVFMLNGTLVAGTKDNVSSNPYTTIVNFIEEVFRNYGSADYDFANTIAERNITGKSPRQYSPSLGNKFVHAIDMKVMPNAPVSSATGLPIPTILVGTSSGLTIFKDDGTVLSRSTTFINSSDPGGVREVSFDEYEGYWYTNMHYPDDHGTVPGHAAVIGHTPSIHTTGGLASSDSGAYGEVMSAIGSDDGGLTTHWTTATMPGAWMTFGGHWNNANSGKIKITPKGDFSNRFGLNRFLPNYADHPINAVAHITTDYNTGYMVGKTKLAVLSNTNTGTNLYDYVEGYGDFTVGSAWNVDSGWSTSGNVATKTGGTGNNYIDKSISRPFVAGKYYRAEFDLLSGSGTSVLLVNRHVSGKPKPFTNATNVDVAFFQGQGNKYYAIWEQSNLNTGLISLYSGQSVSLDNLKVYEIDTLDRSIRSNHVLNIGNSSGGLIKTPVAPGAELMGYSGFSSYNGLVHPYHSSMEPGTGDYSFMIWFKTDPTTNEQTIARRFGNPTVTGGFLMRVLSSSSLISWYTRDTSSSVAVLNSTVAVDDGAWHHVVGVRDGNRAKLYLDGVEVGDISTSANSHDAGSTAQLLIGVENTSNPHVFANPASFSTLALARYALSAPSAEQINKIYNDEKHLFLDNAKATLYGTSSLVTALDYDDDTGLLHAGTGSGRSDFSGLRRINNTTRGVATAISAVDGFVVEE